MREGNPSSSLILSFVVFNSSPSVVTSSDNDLNFSFCSLKVFPASSRVVLNCFNTSAVPTVAPARRVNHPTGFVNNHIPIALILAHTAFVNKLNDNVAVSLAPANPKVEIMASALAPVIPFLAKAFKSSSFVHAFVAIISPVVASIKLASINIAFCFSADNPACAKVDCTNSACILSSLAINPACTRT